MYILVETRNVCIGITHAAFDNVIKSTVSVRTNEMLYYFLSVPTLQIKGVTKLQFNNENVPFVELTNY